MAKMKVLLVDDEEEFVIALAERLQIRDLDPKIAFSGEQALQMLEADIPDTMVLDLKMPGIDGLEVLRRIGRTYPSIKVIILTGHGSQKDAEEAGRLGAFSYFQKPVEIEDLVKSLIKAYHNKTNPNVA